MDKKWPERKAEFTYQLLYLYQKEGCQVQGHPKTLVLSRRISVIEEYMLQGGSGFEPVPCHFSAGSTWMPS